MYAKWYMVGKCIYTVWEARKLKDCTVFMAVVNRIEAAWDPKGRDAEALAESG